MHNIASPLTDDGNRYAIAHRLVVSDVLPSDKDVNESDFD